MIDPVERLIAGFWAHATHGVSALAQTLPRERLGTTDTDDAPPLISVYGAADTPSVAREMIPPSTPAFLVWADSMTDIEIKGVGRAKDVVIAGAYVVDDGADEFTANRECGYFMRAALLSMDRYTVQAFSDGYRELAGVRVVNVGGFREQRVTASVGAIKLLGILTVHAYAVDMAAGRSRNRAVA